MAQSDQGSRPCHNRRQVNSAAPQAFQTPEVERHPGYLMASQAASDLKLWVLETDGMSVNSLGFSAGNMWAADCSSRTTY